MWITLAFKVMPSKDIAGFAILHRTSIHDHATYMRTAFAKCKDKDCDLLHKRAIFINALLRI